MTIDDKEGDGVEYRVQEDEDSHPVVSDVYISEEGDEVADLLRQVEHDKRNYLADGNL